MDLYLAGTELSLFSCLNLIYKRKNPFFLVCANPRTFPAYNNLSKIPHFKGRCFYIPTKDKGQLNHIDLSMVNNVFTIYPMDFVVELLGRIQHPYTLHSYDEGIYSYTDIGNPLKCDVLHLYSPSLYCSREVVPCIEKLDVCVPPRIIREVFGEIANRRDGISSRYFLWCDAYLKPTELLDSIIAECREYAKQNGMEFVRRTHPIAPITSEVLYRVESSFGIPLEIEFLLGRPLPTCMGTVMSSAPVYTNLLCNAQIPSFVYINRVIPYLDDLVECWSTGSDWGVNQQVFQKGEELGLLTLK